mmetsp:Transcript_58290/g.130284  ORF Transcript_58290/g.130284 Transcript_58290/m.130284 type:complete len:229 (+) Transcript_58290:167-853(+)
MARAAAAAAAPSQALEVRYHGPRGSPPSDNLYVKGLPYDTSELDLRELFMVVGTVVDSRIMRGKGMADATALVRMSSVDEATAAIDALSGRDIAEFQLPMPASTGPSHPWTPVRSAARQQDSFVGYGKSSGGPQSLEVRYHGPKGAPPSDNLYVKGLQPAATEQDVRDLFGICGTVQSVRVMRPPPGAMDCTALVRMGSQEEAQSAIEQLSTGPAMFGGNGQARSSPY